MGCAKKTRYSLLFAAKKQENPPNGVGVGHIAINLLVHLNITVVYVCGLLVYRFSPVPFYKYLPPPVSTSLVYIYMAGRSSLLLALPDDILAPYIRMTSLIAGLACACKQTKQMVDPTVTRLVSPDIRYELMDDAILRSHLRNATSWLERWPNVSEVEASTRFAAKILKMRPVDKLTLVMSPYVDIKVLHIASFLNSLPHGPDIKELCIAGDVSDLVSLSLPPEEILDMSKLEVLRVHVPMVCSRDWDFMFTRDFMNNVNCPVLKELTVQYLSGQKLNLEALTRFTTLERLTLGSFVTHINKPELNTKSLVNLSAIGKLVKLTYLDLVNLHWHVRSVLDMQFLGALTDLRGLGIRWMTDMRSLTALTRLETLIVAFPNPLRVSNFSRFDMSALNALRGLRTLHLLHFHYLPCDSLSTLTGLKTLFIRHGPCADLSQLAHLPNNVNVDVAPIDNATLHIYD